MKSVGIKTLKARLSEYLRHVKAGEIVLVSERDEVIAEIRPANRQKADLTFEEAVEQAVGQGFAVFRSKESINWPQLSKIDWVVPCQSNSILNELRDE